MVATKIDGTAIAKSIRERIGREIAERQKLNPRYRPSLKIIQGTMLSQSRLFCPALAPVVPVRSRNSSGSLI